MVAPVVRVSGLAAVVVRLPLVNVKALAICTGVYSVTPVALSIVSVTLFPKEAGTGMVAVLVIN